MATTTSKLWNKKAEIYSKMTESRKSDAYEYEINFPSILNLCPKTSNDVLDLGCGSGDFTQILSQHFKNVTGTDASQNMISIAKKRFPKIKFFVQDLEKPFATADDKSYDLVTCKLVLMFINDIDNVATETYRIIKNGGKLILSVHHPIYWVSKYIEHKSGIKNTPELNVLKNGYFSQVEITKNIGGNADLTFDFIHRTVESYINVFTKVGFYVDKISEPHPTADFIQKHSDTNHDIPSRLNISFIKNIG